MSQSKIIRSLPVTDRETARVVVIYAADGRSVGAGCLLSNTHVMTCCHVVEAALKDRAHESGENNTVLVRIIGYRPEHLFKALVEKIGQTVPTNLDIAILRFLDPLDLANDPVRFVTPLRHEGKRFAVLGFPNEAPDQGFTTSGFLHSADAYGLVQLDSSSPLWAKGGFSGSPVWSPDLDGYIGIVCTALTDREIAWCVPSRVLARFYAELPVRFQISPPDRPYINDWWLDDPNVDLFGSVSNNKERSLTARVKKEDGGFTATLTYRCIGTEKARGNYVTFVTYPDFEDDAEDAYLLFAELDANGQATVEFYPAFPFTVAAIGDAGDTALTIDLERVPGKPKSFKTPDR